RSPRPLQTRAPTSSPQISTRPIPESGTFFLRMEFHLEGLTQHLSDVEQRTLGGCQRVRYELARDPVERAQAGGGVRLSLRPLPARPVVALATPGTRHGGRRRGLKPRRSGG